MPARAKATAKGTAMNEAKATNTPTGSGAGPMGYPTANTVFATVDLQRLGDLVPALSAAGFAPIGILAGEAGLHRLRKTAGDSGIGGMLRRLQMSLGGDLDFVERAQKAIEQGNALVNVDVEGDAAKERARAVFRQHGGQHITYFTQWAIEDLT